MDLKNSFYHVDISEESKKYTGTFESSERSFCNVMRQSCSIANAKMLFR